MAKRLRLLVASLISFQLISTGTAAQAVWQFESENSRRGISAYATTLWAEGYGPVSFSRLMKIDMEEGDLWAVLSLSCSNRLLRASIGLYQAGSGNDPLRLDNPGYVTITLNGTAAKRYRTTGSDSTDIFFITNTDSKNLVRSMMSRSYLSISARVKSESKRVNILFDITGLSKGKTRFRYAGCSL